MTEKQAEALDMVQFSAAKHCLSMPLRAGDIQIVNNFAVFHSRDAFVDGQKQNEKRHMLRLWLRNEELAWATPSCLQEGWANVYGHSGWVDTARFKVTPNLQRDRIVSRKYTCG